METPDAARVPRTLPIVGGHVALDFANTVDDPLGPARHDHASTYEDIVRWSTRVGTLTEPQASRLVRRALSHRSAAAEAVARAHALREALNELFGAVADGERDLRQGWLRLRPFVVDAVGASMLVRQSPEVQRWTWSEVDDLDVVLHPVASSASALLVSEDLRRVKRCARCPWLFVDRSKNQSRRWCDMNDCGKAQKIERYVARRAARRRTG